MYDDGRICPSCGSSDWEDLFCIRTGRIMTGDQRIVPGYLHKIVCQTCGVAANAQILSPEELDHLYGEEYILNTQGGEEHRFFTADGVLPRSQVFFEWIAPHVPRISKTILEIGCGEGNVLARLKHAFPGKRFFGLEGSRKACELARSKGLKVERGMIPGKHPLPKSDLILSINVLEHSEAIGSFLSAIWNAIGPNGRAIFSLPVQDYPGYDIFFAEHVWHFTARQIKNALKRHGFTVIFEDIAHPVNHGIGLFVCRKAPPENADTKHEAAPITRNMNTWLTRFKAVDAWLSSHDGSRIALFGASEVTTLLLAFTSLGDRETVACIDEDPSRLGTMKHSIEVVAPEWLAQGKADAVLLAINPKYHASVREKLQKYQVEIFSFAEQEAMN